MLNQKFRFHLVPQITTAMVHSRSWGSRKRKGTIVMNSQREGSTDKIPDLLLSRREWKTGYVNEDERAVSKVIKYSCLASAGAECTDPDCTWIEQCTFNLSELIIGSRQTNLSRHLGGLQVLDLLGIFTTHPMFHRVHRAGPTQQIYFNLENVKAAIVTSGGPCQGLNDVITQAHSAYHGIRLVKLMGRNSSFITTHATLSSGQVDVCVVPEMPFLLEGPNGVLQCLEHLKGLREQLQFVSEGAGQEFLEKSNFTEASGNAILGDTGIHLQQQNVIGPCCLLAVLPRFSDTSSSND